MHVCLVIPAGAGAASAELGAAVRRHHPDATLVAVWAGDPHLRPAPPDGAEWIDVDLAGPAGVGWNCLLVVLPAVAYQLARGLAAAARHVRAHRRPIAIVRVGGLAIGGPMTGALPATGLAAIRRAAGVPPDDGFAPSAADLARASAWGTALIGVAADGADRADAVARTLGGGGPHDDPGGRLAIALDDGDVHPVRGGIVLGWGDEVVAGVPHEADEIALVDVDRVDRAEPWRVTFDGRRARLRFSEHPSLARLVRASEAQWSVTEVPIRLPGGVAIDMTIRHLVADAIERWRRGEGVLPPEPFGRDASAFLAWLETPWPPWGPDVGRYWTELWHTRPDLATAFPHPEGVDLDAFVGWASESWRFERRSPLIRPGADLMRPDWVDGGHRADGINLIGYLGFDKSLGDVARRIHRSLAAADVPTAALHYNRSGSPTSVETPELTDTLEYDTNIVVINADQMHLVDADHGPVVFAGRYTIAYWFWELAYVPPAMVAAIDLVDEIWVATDFTADAFRAVTDKPVRSVWVPVPEPTVSDRTRAELGLPADRFVFLVTLDHLSVTERKNPIAAVDAFRRAFPVEQTDGPVLVVKTLNAEHRWTEHERIGVAVDGRDDVVVIDRHLARPDQMALTAAADCLVSLHRAEGLGLHLMEAMWLGTPTIATRYSGNLAFMDDANSALVDAHLVGVEHGEAYFPAEAEWADPDLDQAAGWMRRMVAEPELRQRLGAAGRARMQQQPGLAETGRTIARLSRAARDASRGSDRTT